MAQKKIAPKQIDLLVGQVKWSTNLVLSAAPSQAVTSYFAGMVSGGSDTTAGVIASPQQQSVLTCSRVRTSDY